MLRESGIMTDIDVTASTDGLDIWRTVEEFVTLGEIARAARERLEPGPWNFLDGAAGDERGLVENRGAFAHWQFRPRFMAGISRPDPSSSLLGVDLSMPVITSPFGFDALFHADGHIAVAQANEAEGVAMVAPEISSCRLEDLAAAAPTACRFFQLVPFGEDHFLRTVERCAEASYAAVCVTVDTPVPGWRERSMEDRFVPDVTMALGNHRPDLGVDLVASLTSMVKFEQPTWTWEKLGEIGRRAALPWFPKGVLTREDARAAVDAVRARSSCRTTVPGSSSPHPRRSTRWSRSSTPWAAKCRSSWTEASVAAATSRSRSRWARPRWASVGPRRSGSLLAAGQA